MASAEINFDHFFHFLFVVLNEFYDGDSCRLISSEYY